MVSMSPTAKRRSVHCMAFINHSGVAAAAVCTLTHAYKFTQKEKKTYSPSYTFKAQFVCTLWLCVVILHLGRLLSFAYKIIQNSPCLRYSSGKKQTTMYRFGMTRVSK